MKKKIISLCLVLALALIAVGGATMAYFTDKDTADNEFTLGYVDITLNEQERTYDDDGNVTGLQKFTQNKILVPGHNDAQEEKDRYGMPVSDNYVDKIVTVTNNGNTDAYIRVIVAVPAALEEKNPESAAYNVLHWNTGNKVDITGNYDAAATKQPENEEWANKEVYWKVTGTATVDEIKYNVYTIYYKNALAPKATSAAAFAGFYLDKGVDCEQDAEGNLYYTFDGKKINYDLNKGVKILVEAQAVQAAGFDSAEKAFAAVNFPAIPWAE